MNAENFRSGREEVDRIIQGVGAEIRAKFVRHPDKKINQIQQIVDDLAREASGEIQNRSIHNMNMEIEYLKRVIEKLPVKKQPAIKRAKKK